MQWVVPPSELTAETGGGGEITERQEGKQADGKEAGGGRTGHAGGGHRGALNGGSGVDVSRNPVQDLPGTGSAFTALPRQETGKAPGNPQLTPLPGAPS